jgi:hypothetical protein
LVAHNVGPYTQPSLAFAKRTWLTEADDVDEADANGAGGGAVAAQVLLPFAVDRRAVHGWLAQGEVPRAKPCEAETKLTDPGSKCAGTATAVAPAPVPEETAPPTRSTVHAIFMVRIVEPTA